MSCPPSKRSTPSSTPAILVVDDEPAVLKLLARHLTDQGHRVIPARSAQEACRHLEDHRIALVVLDWDLSRGVTGPEEPDCGQVVLAACRQQDAHLPVIVISGYQGVDVRSDALLANASSFVAKPFSLHVLEQHVRHWLQPTTTSLPPSLPRCPDAVLSLEELKRRYTRVVVSQLKGNMAEAARRLGVHRHTVASLLHETTLGSSLDPNQHPAGLPPQPGVG